MVDTVVVVVVVVVVAVAVVVEVELASDQAVTRETEFKITNKSRDLLRVSNNLENKKI